MRTLIKFGVPLVAVLLFVAPGAVGLLAYPHLETGAEQLRTAVADYARETDRDLSRGWFTSRFRAEYALGDALVSRYLFMFAGLPETAALPTLVVDAVIYHGPLPLAPLGQGGLRPSAGALTARFYLVSGGHRVPLPATANGWLGPGGLNAAVRVDPLAKRPWDEATTWSFGGGTADIASNGDFSELQGSINFSEMLFGDDGEGLVVVRDLHLFAALNSTGKRATGRLDIDIGAAGLAGQNSDGIRLALAYDVDRNALHEYLEAATGWPDDAPQSAERAMAQVLGFAATGMELSLTELYFGTPLGAVRGQIDTSLPAGDENPLNMMRRASGTMHLEIPVELAGLLATLVPDGETVVQGAVAGGFVKRDGDLYVTDLDYQTGDLTVNGFPVPLPF